MAFTEMGAFTVDFTTYADKPNKTAAEMKAALDSHGDELKTYLNDTLLDELEASTDGSSGADSLGMTQLTNNGSATETAQAQTEALDAAIGARAYTEHNYVTDGESTAASLDALDIQVKGNADAVSAHLADYASKFPDNAGAHNSIYRGKNLGTSVTTKQYADIANGTFEDMYIGDYWIINSRVYRIAVFNYYMQKGDTATTANHITLVPDVSLYTHVMNDTNIITGGYMGSKMYTEGLNNAKTTIKSDFSGHVLNHRKLLSNATTDEKASGWAWANSEVDLMNEVMVYGSIVWGESAIGGSGYNIGEGMSQLPLFVFRPDMISANRQYFWLRDVVSATNFAYVRNNGSANYYAASGAYGVRPAFSIS